MNNGNDAFLPALDELSNAIRLAEKHLGTVFVMSGVEMDSGHLFWEPRTKRIVAEWMGERKPLGDWDVDNRILFSAFVPKLLAAATASKAKARQRARKAASDILAVLEAEDGGANKEAKSEVSPGLKER